MRVGKVPLIPGIPAEACCRLLAVIRGQPKIRQVTLFGSRAKGNYRPGSDIDLCLDAPDLTLSEKLALDNAIDDLMLPWKVDLVVWQAIDNVHVREHILRVGLPVSVKEEASAAADTSAAAYRV